MDLLVDGAAVTVPDGATILEACDLAGRYVPRLCSYPSIGCGCEMGVRCGLCAVAVEEGPQRAQVLACFTRARPGMSVITAGEALQAERLRRLTDILERHPHVCLTCPDREGCTRAECTFGVPAEARCCAEFGRCEIAKLIAHVDARTELPRRAVAVSRASGQEGRIRREAGLCVGCGRCVRVCEISSAAGKALRLDQTAQAPPATVRAIPKQETLRASGCTFCGLCVMVCPTGALTAPGEIGARWLDGRRQRNTIPVAVLPPSTGWRPLNVEEVARLTGQPGVFRLADATGSVLRIGGVADLAQGINRAVADPSSAGAERFQVERAELFTERESELLAAFTHEHGRLPPGNDLGDELFTDDLFDEVPE